MIYLDTHVTLWLYEGMLDKFSDKAKDLLEANEIKISPMVVMELQYLYEIKRSKVSANKIVDRLSQQIYLKICDLSFVEIITLANKIDWTRDPFDRIIVANAMVNKTLLLTKDKIIRKHYKLAIWQ